MHFLPNWHCQVPLIGVGKEMKMGVNQSGYSKLRPNRYFTSSFTVAVKRDAQGTANVLDRESLLGTALCTGSRRVLFDCISS